VVQVGDLLDMKAPARWSKGTAAEYCNSVREEADAGIEFWRNAAARRPATPNWCGSLATTRTGCAQYVNSYAPALRDIVPVVAELMRLDEFGVKHPKVQPWTDRTGCVLYPRQAAGYHSRPLCPQGIAAPQS
jgi:hypothetical protein